MPTLHREGGGTVHLPPSAAVAQGGQGTVYIVGNTAYKVVFDPAQALTAARRDALATLGHPAIVRPGRRLFTPEGTPVGHEMPAVDGLPWLSLVPTPAWHAQGLDPAGALGLCAALGAAVAAAHAGGAVLGDLNPLNVLVHRDLGGLWLVDTDAWGIAGAAPQAMLPALADPRMAPGGPTRATDWWGVAVDVFQLLTGLHPFRGHHPRVSGLAARARAGLWALDPAVATPPATRSLAGVPAGWRDWLGAVLTGAHRGPPPAAAQAPCPAALPAVVLPGPRGGRPAGPETGARLATTLRCQAPGPLRGVVPAGAGHLCWTDDLLLQDGHPVAPLPGRGGVVVPAPAGAGCRALWAGLRDGLLRVVPLGGPAATGAGAPLPLAVAARGLTVAGGRVLVHAGDGIFALEAVAVGARLHAGLRRLAGAHPRAAVLHDGVVASMLGGAAWLGLSPAAGRWLGLRVPALDGQPVVAAVARGRVVVALVRRRDGSQTTVDRVVVRVAADGLRHDVQRSPDVGVHGLGLARLPRGVAVFLDENGDLVIIPEGVGQPGERRVAAGDRALWGLWALGGQLCGAAGDRLLGLSMVAAPAAGG